MHRDKYEAKLQELDSKEREFSDYKRDVRAHFNVWSKPLVLELKLEYHMHCGQIASMLSHTCTRIVLIYDLRCALATIGLVILICVVRSAHYHVTQRRTCYRWIGASTIWRKG